jgi:putative Holliday junction resolvase
MRYLGIDYGTKKIGLALSDEAGMMGFPYRIVPNDAMFFEMVRQLVAAESVGAVVIGDSLDFSGNENKVAAEARAFAAQLEAAGITVFFEPEMLTTQEARRDIEGVRGHGDVDASAAALILTSFLSHHTVRPNDV